MTENSLTRRSTAPSPFGRLLRFWRHRRGMSQLELALAGGGSQRHVSFLESGRSQPGREMVLRLAAALELPLRERNRLLEAAGFAASYPQRPFPAPELASVRRALSAMLQALEPYPVLVVDRLWNVQEANAAAGRLLARLVRPEALAAAVDAQGRPNVVRLLVHPRGLRPCVRNWPEVAAELWLRVQRELAEFGEDADAQGLMREVRQALGDSTPGWVRGDRSAPVLPLSLEAPGFRVELFSTIATLGTPQDVTLQELRIESFFPADEASERALRDLAAQDGA